MVEKEGLGSTIPRRQWPLSQTVGKCHLQEARAHTSTPSSRYLGPQAQLVDGVLRLGILGEELVVVLLQERDSKVVTCLGSSLRGPSQGTHSPKGASGFLKVKKFSVGIMYNAEPHGKILGCQRQQGNSASSPPTVLTMSQGGGPLGGCTSMHSDPHHRGPQLLTSRSRAHLWALWVGPHLSSPSPYLQLK